MSSFPEAVTRFPAYGFFSALSGRHFHTLMSIFDFFCMQTLFEPSSGFFFSSSFFICFA